MKKIFTIAILSAAILSATAGLNTVKVSESAVRADKAMNLRTAVASSSATPKMRAAATDYDSYTWTLLGEGEYSSSVVADTYSSENPVAAVKIYEAEGHAGVYKAEGVWPDMAGVDTQTLIVDASNPDFIVVPKQFTGIDDTVDGETYIASQTWVARDEQGYSEDVIIAEIPELLPYLNEKVIYFPAGALGLNWPNAPADSKYETDPNAWYVGKNSGYLALPGGEPVDPWTLYGKATMSGDWVFSIFGKEIVSYETEVYVATDNDKKFKVVDPLKGLYAAIGADVASPDIALDATDPANVVLEMTTTGINGGDTDGMYYIFNEGYYGRVTEEDIDEALLTTLTTDEKKAVFNFPAKSLTLMGSVSGGFYYGNMNEAAVITVDLDQSGVSVIGEEIPNAAPEYYNLQGIRVAAPQSGSLVICRQGDSVSKILVK